MDVYTLILLTFATYRVAYLIAVEDGPGDSMAWLRLMAERHFVPVEVAPGYLSDHWIVRGLHCPLCVSFWAAPAMLAAWIVAPLVVWWLAVAGGVLIVHRWMERHDRSA